MEVFRLIQGLNLIVNLFHNLGDPLLCSWIAIRRVDRGCQGPILPAISSVLAGSSFIVAVGLCIQDGWMDDSIYPDPSPELNPGFKYKCDNWSILRDQAICSCSSSSPCCLMEWLQATPLVPLLKRDLIWLKWISSTGRNLTWCGYSMVFCFKVDANVDVNFRSVRGPENNQNEKREMA